jgi:hypothetical protein
VLWQVTRAARFYLPEVTFDDGVLKIAQREAIKGVDRFELESPRGHGFRVGLRDLPLRARDAQRVRGASFPTQTLGSVVRCREPEAGGDTGEEHSDGDESAPIRFSPAQGGFHHDGDAEGDTTHHERELEEVHPPMFGPIGWPSEFVLQVTVEHSVLGQIENARFTSGQSLLVFGMYNLVVR